MISGLTSSLSGLSASQTKLNVTAHNVANANTDGFKKSRTILQESVPGGVQATIQQVNTPGPVAFKDTDQGLTPVEQSNVDLGDEMVDLLSNQRFFEVNLRAVDIQDQTLGTLLDIIG